MVASVGARVLIVDDSRMIRRMLRDILADSQFEVVGEAGSGEEAMMLYRAAKPDIVTMDIGLPGKDGIYSFQKIREVAPDVRVVVITAETDESFRLKAMDEGADGYITKPFTKEEVVEALGNL